MLECCRVLPSKKFSNLAEINDNNRKKWNVAEPIDVAVLSMSWVSFIWFIMPAT